MSHRSNRRDFLKTTSTAALAGATLPYWFTAESNRALGFQSVNSRLHRDRRPLAPSGRWRAESL